MARLARTGTVLIASTVLIAGLAACSSSSKSSSSGGGGSSSAASSGSSAASKTITQASVDFGTQFIGGKAGKADSSLSPVTIGWVNEDAGTPAYPEYTAVAKATVDFINNQLGGIQGHPLALDMCGVQSEEDGQKCAAQFLANKDISIADVGLIVVGNESLYKTINGAFPTVVDVGASPADSTSKDVYNLDSGAIGVLNAMAVQAKTEGAKSVSIIAADNAGGRQAAQTIMTPILQKEGITPKSIYIPEGATTPQVTSALQAAGGLNADAVILVPSEPANCNQLSDSMKQLGVQKPVISFVFCSADEVVAHVGAEGLSKWSLASFGSNTRVADPQTDVFTNVMTAAGVSSSNINEGYTFKTMGDLLTIAKFANTIGPDKLSAAAFQQQILAWKGPAFMIPGTMACGTQQITIGVCGTTATLTGYKDGKWQNLGTVTVGQ